MEYNTQRPPLVISDYGRNVAKMIDYCKTLPTKEERTKMAETIVDAMALVNPKVRERTDYRQILWDHLFVIANNDLDVDCPYERRDNVEVEAKPHRLMQKEGNLTYRHYGRTLENMIKALSEMPESKERTYLMEQVAHTMKRQYLQWNRDTVDDALIGEQLTEMSGGVLKLPETFRFKDTKIYLDAMAAAHAKRENESKGKKKKKKKNNNNNNQ